MTRLALSSPFRDVALLHDEVDRFLRAGQTGMASAWTPAMDVAESEDGWLFTIELPGMSKDDVTISLEDGVLTIAGERTRPTSEADGEGEAVTWRRVERRMGAFQRSVRLPERIDAENVEASMRDGLLAISLPKADEAKPRTIAIL